MYTAWSSSNLHPCSGLQSLNHWTVREVPFYLFYVYKFYIMYILITIFKNGKKSHHEQKKFIKTNDFPPILVLVCLCSCCFLSSDCSDTAAMGEGNWILWTLSAKLKSKWIEWVITRRTQTTCQVTKKIHIGMAISKSFPPQPRTFYSKANTTVWEKKNSLAKEGMPKEQEVQKTPGRETLHSSSCLPLHEQLTFPPPISWDYGKQYCLPYYSCNISAWPLILSSTWPWFNAYYLLHNLYLGLSLKIIGVISTSQGGGKRG